MTNRPGPKQCKLQKKLTLLQRERGELTAGATNNVREAVLFVSNEAEAAQTIRQAKNKVQPIIIACTASLQVEEIPEFLGGNFNDVLRKPFRADDVFGMLQTYLAIALIES